MKNLKPLSSYLKINISILDVIYSTLLCRNLGRRTLKMSTFKKIILDSSRPENGIILFFDFIKMSTISFIKMSTFVLSK